MAKFTAAQLRSLRAVDAAPQQRMRWGRRSLANPFAHRGGKRLNLDKTTLAHLGSARMAHVNGGRPPDVSFAISNCDCPTQGRYGSIRCTTSETTNNGSVRNVALKLFSM